MNILKIVEHVFAQRTKGELIMKEYRVNGKTILMRTPVYLVSEEVQISRENVGEEQLIHLSGTCLFPTSDESVADRAPENRVNLCHLHFGAWNLAQVAADDQKWERPVVVKTGESEFLRPVPPNTEVHIRGVIRGKIIKKRFVGSGEGTYTLHGRTVAIVRIASFFAQLKKSC